MKAPKPRTAKTKSGEKDRIPAKKTPVAIEKPPDIRQLRDLVSVNRLIMKDFEALGIKTVAELARHEPKELYRKLCRLSRERHDVCTEDVFSAMIAQAKNPQLDPQKCDWWYWNRRRQRAPKTSSGPLAGKTTAADSLPSKESPESKD